MNGSEPGTSPDGFGVGLARAFAGAILFGLPLLMTMEMWWLGFLMQPGRLALLLALFFPFLILLSWHAGFEPTFSWRDDVVDALVAFAVGIVSAALVLALLGVLRPGVSTQEAVGTVALQAIPGSIGALLAQTQLGDRTASQSPEHGGEGYFSDLFIMAVGALFLAFNLAPTDEIPMTAMQITEWQAVLLVFATLAVMHAFVFGVAFRDQHRRVQPGSAASVFARHTVVGYVLASALAAGLLWCFGRLDGLGLLPALKNVVVLAFPAALGAAAARLIL